MELKLDEQKLLADYRRLAAEGRIELLDYAAFLVKKYRDTTTVDTSPAANQCTIDKEESRPEAVKEPLFTE